MMHLPSNILFMRRAKLYIPSTIKTIKVSKLSCFDFLQKRNRIIFRFLPYPLKWAKSRKNNPLTINYSVHLSRLTCGIRLSPSKKNGVRLSLSTFSVCLSSSSYGVRPCHQLTKQNWCPPLTLEGDNISWLWEADTVIDSERRTL